MNLQQQDELSFMSCQNYTEIYTKGKMVTLKEGNASVSGCNSEKD